MHSEQALGPPRRFVRIEISSFIYANTNLKGSLETSTQFNRLQDSRVNRNSLQDIVSLVNCIS